MRIAIIGGGISGLTSAYLLADEHEVVLFEAENRLGGHTHTVDVPWGDRTYRVDTGFIVFNKKTYPNFTKLMRRLEVPWQPSRMSFSVKCEKTGLQFSPSTFNSLFIQRRNLFRPGFYRMLADIFRFKHVAKELLHSGDYNVTLHQFLKSRGFSRPFIEHFIIPMGAAIWSADPKQFKRFPALLFIRFFKNHGFLDLYNQPLWLTVQGGSSRYIEPLSRPFKKGVRLNSPVNAVRRKNGHVEVAVQGAGPERFDAVVIAAHSDQALELLSDPSESENNILGQIRYQENRTLLHTDSSILPSRKAAWASWNYFVPGKETGRLALTYHMNTLQRLQAPVDFCVSLNMDSLLQESKILFRMLYHHPAYSPESLSARKRLHEINGVRQTFFAGAYWGYGFHEDGVNSALEVCRHFGKTL